MNKNVTPLDLSRLKVLSLAKRHSLSSIDAIMVDPDATAPACPDGTLALITQAAQSIRAAHQRQAAVILFYGAHLVKNGGAALVQSLLHGGWISHLATNGAGAIHDWEFAFQQRSTESVRDNVAKGTFGIWDETGRNFQLALLAGALDREGFGTALGRFIQEEGVNLPAPHELTSMWQEAPTNPLAPARAELLRAMHCHHLAAGRHDVPHPWKHTSILAAAFRLGVPLTIHPGIGYDIFTNHPMFNGAVVGRAAEWDFLLLGGSLERLDGGVVLSVGSAIMAPQVFEKSLSCVNNLRLQSDRAPVHHHSIYVVDLQDGGGWDWSRGEPPKDNPAYYLRFCKSYSRMGGAMHYVQCDNILFFQHLVRLLKSS